MYNEAVRVVNIKPSRFNENVDQLAFFSIPLQPAFDGEIGILTDIALRRKPPSEVPNTFEITKHYGLWQFEKRLQMRELWMIWYGP